MEHNLNISLYTLDEILGLFDMTYDTMDLEGIKRAKKKVLMTHPDKSRLPADYFLFYKRAFEIVVGFYEENTKISKPVQKQVYQAANPDKNTAKIINETKDFNRKFNELFATTMAVKPDANKNQWFSSDEPMYALDKKVPMNDAMIAVKQQQQSRVIMKRSQVQQLGGFGTNLYDDDEQEYVSSDPFSRLKYDDLRKVHKDQTVLAVSEADFQNVKAYGSVDELKRDRGFYEPLAKTEADIHMEKQRRDMLLKKQYEASLRATENEQKGRTVLGSFLRLGV
jgi:hypothetical protein